MVTENVNIIISARGAATAARGIRSVGTSSRTAAIAVRALGVALTAVAGGATIGALFRLSDAATEVGNRIRTTTGSTEVFLSVQQRLFEVASRTGASIEDTARLFQRLTVGTEDLGVGSARVVNVVEGLNAALVVSGSTAREASAALLQLGQGLASDNLSGEELRSLRENLPQLAQALSRELGKSIGDLKELGRQGRLNAETVFPALERAIGKFNEQLRNGEVVFTFAQAFNAVRNEILRFFTIIQKATNGAQTFNKAIFDFADGLAERLVNGLADAIDFTVRFAGVFQEQFANLRSFLSPVVEGIRILIDNFAILAQVATIVANQIRTPFRALNAGVRTVAAGAASLGNAFGLVGDETAAGLNAAAEAAQTTLVDGITETLDTIQSLGSQLLGIGDATAEGAGQAKRELSDLEQFAFGVSQALRDATGAVALADDPQARPPTFLERAATNTGRIRTEAGAEDIDVPPELSASIAGAFQEGLAEGIRGGDFLGTLQESLETASQDALITGFQRGVDVVQGVMEEAFKSVAAAIGPVFGDAFGDLGPVLGDVLKGALQFAVLQGLNALLGGGGNSATSSTGNVQSAVTSTQAVRGIVAGPTEIAIANVGRNIAEAIEPLLDETRVQTAIQRGILNAVIAGGGTGGGTADDASLAFESAPLAAI